MWSASYIRGHFFAGFRTTSRCEALHAQLGKFIGYRNDLAELIQHFQRAINLMRNSEIEADFNSLKGVPMEKNAKVDFQVPSTEGLWSAESLRYCRYGSLMDWCRRLCKVASMNAEDYRQIRAKLSHDTFLLEAKQGEKDSGAEPSEPPQPSSPAETATSKQPNLTTQPTQQTPFFGSSQRSDRGIRDPVMVRSKGCTPSQTKVQRKPKRNVKCGICKTEGHNRRMCPIASVVDRLKNKYVADHNSEEGFSNEELEDDFEL
ncbi:hypothetical protein RIF29_29498 [Crotalaria pallida]|uniref:Protein FAR1-RELATED SEQUENCE n=1 Tax=Crotalaria pallida TaxID=3830 RepID=A0AAN9EJW2_CROPI